MPELVARPKLETGTTIPEGFLYMFQGKHVPHLTTLLEDGSPRCSLVWCDFDGTCLRFSASTTHVVCTTLAKDPRAVVMVADASVLDRYIEIRCIVEKTVPDPEAAHVYRLAKLRGVVQPAPYPDAARRVILYLKPTLVNSFIGYEYHY